MSGDGPDRGVTPPGHLPAGELRHELRTPVNIIVGYCEMLIEAGDPEDREWREGLDEALRAVREALTQINAALPPTAATAALSDMLALRNALRLPQERIVASVRALAAHPAARFPEVADDLDRVMRAAERLTEMGTMAAPAEFPSVQRAAPSAPLSSRAIAPAVVLVVDDIEENREVLSRRLRRDGHEVVVSVNGVEALETVATRHIDLVLLDVMMPEVDGFEVLRRLKDSDATRDLPVIMISALDDLVSMVRCIEQGADDYLAKPFDPVLLRARIGACLDRKRARDRERDYLAQVSAVVEASLAVEEGRYTSTLLVPVGRRGDELGRLARVFDRMAAGVRARETRLSGQLGELRREIALARAGSGAAGSSGSSS